MPKEYALDQNYPNPFNPITTIRYDLPMDSKIVISIYNILGREVKKLVDEDQPAGYRWVEWDAGNFTSGVYFYRITAQGEGKNYVNVKKMMILK